SGASPVKLPDLSVRFGGKRPDKDTYAIEAATDLPAVTGVRLEVLADESLPHRGPGRQDNGNLHLSEFRVEASPAADPKQRRPVPRRCRPGWCRSSRSPRRTAATPRRLRWRSTSCVRRWRRTSPHYRRRNSSTPPPATSRRRAASGRPAAAAPSTCCVAATCV